MEKKVIGAIVKGTVFKENCLPAQIIEQVNKTVAMPTLLLEQRGEDKVLHVLTHGANLTTVRFMLKAAIEMVEAELGVA